MKKTITLLAALAMAVCPAVAAAETLVAATTIRAKTKIGPEHLALSPNVVPGGLTDPSEVLGQEAHVAIYAGRPIRAGDIGPPALVERNQIVTLLFHKGGLAIQTEGRALDRAAAGEPVRALNLASRNTITGVVDGAGRIHVGTALILSGSR